MENLHKAFQFGGVLSLEAIARVTQQFGAQALRAGEQFLTPGQVSNRIGFVEAGVCQGYLMGQQSEEEKTTYFYRPGQFVLDIESFYSHQPSRLGIRAMTACQLLSIERAHWYQLLEEVPQLFILSKSLTEAALLNKFKDRDFLHFGTARQKYQEFVRRYPDLVLSVPQRYIASYLGVTPQSLSRLRKE